MGCLSKHGKQLDLGAATTGPQNRQALQDAWPPPIPRACPTNQTPVPVQYHKPHAVYCPNNFPRKVITSARRWVLDHAYDEITMTVAPPAPADIFGDSAEIPFAQAQSVATNVEGVPLDSSDASYNAPFPQI